MYPKNIKDLMECFELLPGIGEKTAERLSFSLINFDKDKLTEFADSIIGIRDNIKNCKVKHEDGSNSEIEISNGRIYVDGSKR